MTNDAVRTQVELVDQELENRALEVEDQKYELQQIQGELAPQAWWALIF